MKDEITRFYIHKVLLFGICLSAALSVLGILFDERWAAAAILSILLLPISRLITEAIFFMKEGKPKYTVLSITILAAIAASFFFSI